MTEWRLIDTGIGDAFSNMAIDEALSFSVRKGNSPPILRFYGWDSPTLSIGRHQGAEGIDFPYLKGHGIGFVRRPTGGRAILHREELTYSFSSRNEPPFSGGLRESYKLIAIAFAKAFRQMGIDVVMEDSPRGHYSKTPLCFKSRSFGELSFNGIKLTGSAQRRWKDGFLQQGSIPYILDDSELSKIFGLPPKDQGPSQVISPEAGTRLKHLIKISFEEVFGIRFINSEMTSSEKEMLSRFLKKYQGEKWNLSGLE